jgi:hypothetical protein
MPDREPGVPAARAELRQQIRDQLQALEPGLRVVAENVLGLASPIDLIAVDAKGSAVAVVIAGQGEDAEQFTRALAERSWLGPRVRDWAQLAPHLGIQTDMPPRIVLAAPDFAPETEAAAASLRAGVLRLVRYYEVAGANGRTLRLEHMVPRPAPGVVQPGPQVPDAEPLPAFRSGLSESDLGLTVDDPAELRRDRD